MKDNNKDLQYTLQHLIEECAEVIHATSKIKRFGLYDKYNNIINKQKFEIEVIQLLLLINKLKEFDFDFNTTTELELYIHNKWEEWKNYSERVLKEE